MTDDWMADAEEQVEQALDRDDATGDRLWRHRLTGNTANVVALAARGRKRQSVVLNMPIAEHVIVSEIARDCGLSPVDLVRQCVFTHLTEDCAIPAERLSWLGRAGLLP